jgi:rod shape-determining protein MreC
MVTSRDDFIIAIRSAFLKKGTQQKFSLFTLIILSIIFLFFGKLNYKIVDYIKVGINEVVYRASYIASSPEKIFLNSFYEIKNHLSLYESFKVTKKELKILKSKDLSKKIIVFENEKLKKIIDDYVVTDNEIFAKVLIDKKSPFLRSVILNKGSRDNMLLGMAVLDGINLVGKIVEVNYTTSRVLLLSDLNSKIPVSIEPGDIQAVVTGTGNDYGLIQYLKEEYIMRNEKDAILYTSGTGGLFKSGIPIGTIKYENLILPEEKKVDFYSDFTQLKYVKALSFSDKKISLAKEAQNEIIRIDDQITEIKSQSKRLNILLNEKKVTEEIKIKIEKENIELKIELINLKNELTETNRLLIEKEGLIVKNKVDDEEIKFLKLNLVHGSKCQKKFINNLYKVGTTAYRNCVLRRGKNILND